MKKILNEKGSLIARSIIFQIAMSIFGIMICLATAKMGDSVLLLSGIFSILFYYALVGATYNEEGLKDKMKFERNREKFDYLYGLKCAAVSYIPSLIITVVYSVLRVLNVAESFTYILNMLIRSFISAMYLGLDIFLFSGVDGNENIVYNQFSLNGFSFIIYQIISICACGLFYYVGMKGINLVKKKNDER